MLLIVSFATNSSIFAATFTVFGTGVDNNGNVLPGGSIDPHYTITGPGATGSRAVVYSGANIFSSWVPNDAHSAWVGSRTVLIQSRTGRTILLLRLI
jgi:hypothetical protein